MPSKSLCALALLMSIFLVQLSSQETQKESTQIEWAAVDRANLYLLEIKQGDEIIHSIETEMTYIPLFLSGGEYSIRISIVNKFGKVSSQGEWSPLVVTTHPQPVIQGVTPTFCFNDVEAITLSIKGEGFEEDCQFILTSDIAEVPGNIIMRESRSGSKIYLVRFDAKQLPRRTFWDLKVTNPTSGKNFTVQSSLRVGVRESPIVRSIEPDELFYEVNPGRIIIVGKNFTDEVTLIFEGPGVVVPTDTLVKPKLITFLLNFDALPVGDYTVTVENDTGLRSEPTSFTIEERPASKAERALKLRENNPHFVAVYYHPSFVNGEAEERYKNSGLGLGFNYRRRFNNPGIFDIPFLRYGGYLASIDTSSLSFESDSSRTMWTNHFNFGIFYLSELDFPVNFFFSVQAGVSLSYHFSDEQDTIYSPDFTHKFEWAIQYDRFDFGTFEVGVALSQIHLTNNTLEMTNPYILYGRDF